MLVSLVTGDHVMLLIDEKHISLSELLAINESKASDDFEKAVADNISKLSKDHVYSAERPVSDNRYSDVIITRNDGTSAWLEVKMDHHAGVGSPRVYYSDYEGGWATTYTSPSAAWVVELLNNNDEVKRWVNDFKKWLCNELKTTKDKKLLEIVKKPKENKNYKPSDLQIVIPTTGGGLKEHGAIPFDVMYKYVDENNKRYILTYECDISKLIEDHYTKGKAEPTYYIQAGDDLYRLGNKNPFSWKLPRLKAPDGTCSIRVSTRHSFYEVQVDIKTHTINDSEYSLKPNSQKLSPF